MFGHPAAINDNIETRKIYADQPECLPHISAARYLISKYVSEYWKNDQDDMDYVYQEIALCRHLLTPVTSPGARQLKIKWLARALGVSTLWLLNDPKLPF